jgi:hypothetical protein
MKVSELIAVLQAAASLYEECGSGAKAEALRVLSSLCAGHESQGVAAFVGVVGKALTEPIATGHQREIGGSVRIAELAGGLEQIYSISALVGTKGAANDIRKFLDLLKVHIDYDVVGFVRHSQECLKLPQKGKRAASTGKKRTAPAPDPATIENYEKDLKRAGTDRAGFEEVFSRLKRDKKLKKADLIELVHRYSGAAAKYKTKDAAIEEIEITFVRNARFLSKIQ